MKLLLIATLIFCGFASSSFAKSSATQKASAQTQCVANIAELESHPDRNQGCSRAGLTQQLRTVPKGLLDGQGWAAGTKLEFPANVPSGAFYITLNGDPVRGQLCCVGGVWSIKGYGAISVVGGVLRIGGYTFKKATESKERFSTPTVTAEGRG